MLLGQGRELGLVLGPEPALELGLALELGQVPVQGLRMHLTEMKFPR